MANRFGTNEEPNLDALLAKSLVALERMQSDTFDFHFGPLWDLKQIPGKNYRAAGKADAYCDGMNGLVTLTKPLTVVVFAPYDGTGNREDYYFPELKAQYTPRIKDVPGLEIMIPIGTAIGNKWIDWAANLTHFSIEGIPSPVFENELGVEQGVYENILYQALAGENLIVDNARVADYTQNSKTNLGDAHAVGFLRMNPELLKASEGTWLQVAAFLNLPADDDKIRSNIDLMSTERDRYFIVR